ncbi:uncharacterized protein LOC135349290 isoform X3 [Halichondria panicea]
MRGHGIGTKYASYYKAFATTLAERGERGEAIRVLEGGVQAEARPLNLLTQFITELKGGQISKTVLDDKSERNDGFYRQSGIAVHYQKELVYPRDGGEISLEHIRGALPCYAPSFSCYAHSFPLGEDDMDMTEAQLGHITEHVQFKQNHHLPSVRTPRAELVGLLSDHPQTDPPLSASNRKRIVSDEDIEQQLVELVLERDREMAEGHTSTMGDSHAHSHTPNIAGDDLERELFGNVSNVMSQQVSNQTTKEENLSAEASQPPSPPPELVANKENMIQSKTPFDFTPGCAGGVSIPKAESDVHELVGRLNFSEAELSVHQLSMHQRSAHTADLFNTSLECEKRAKLTNEQEQFENEFANPGYGPAYQPPSLINESSFGVFHDSWAANKSVGFSKSAISKSAISRPEPQRSNVSGQSAFSRMDTAPTKRVALQVRGPVVRKPLQPLSMTTDTSHSEDYSLNSYRRLPPGVDSHVSFQPSLMADSFSVCEDPTHDQSSFAPHRRLPPGVDSHVSFQPSLMADSFSVCEDPTHDQSSFAPHRRLPPGVDSHVSFQPSLMADSFSVCEDPTHDQSSFAPYHDSWAKPPPQQPSHSNTDGGGVYHAPVGVPLTKGQGSGDMNRTIDQSFTQFDIPRPKGSLPYSAASTPAGQRVNRSVMPLNMDLSVIPSHDPPATTEPLLSNKPPLPSQGVINRSIVVVQPPASADLSTITEESENYRSSQSSSRFTVSSGSSRFSTSSASSQGTVELLAEGVNPFQPAIVNMMLNKAGGSERITVIMGEAPDVMSGCMLVLKGVKYACVGVDREVGLTKHCTLRQDDLTLKTLKVSSGSQDWEVSVLELLGTRLNSHSLQGAVSSFVQVETALRFRQSSFLISQYHPYGSIQDLTSSTIFDCVSLYLTCELATAVAALHQCKILHTAIAPHNIMIRDLRMFQDVRSALGHGVCLLDFSTAVDLTCFPDDVSFVGSGRTVCPQMKEGKPWKWQVDYFGLAGVIHTLLTGTGLVMYKDNGVYHLDHPLPRRHRAVLGQLVDVLVNSVDTLPLMELIQPIQAQLLTTPNKTFRREVQQCYKS